MRYNTRSPPGGHDREAESAGREYRRLKRERETERRLQRENLVQQAEDDEAVDTLYVETAAALRASAAEAAQRKEEAPPKGAASGAAEPASCGENRSEDGKGDGDPGSPTLLAKPSAPDADQALSYGRRGREGHQQERDEGWWRMEMERVQTLAPAMAAGVVHTAMAALVPPERRTLAGVEAGAKKTSPRAVAQASVDPVAAADAESPSPSAVARADASLEGSRGRAEDKPHSPPRGG